MSAAQISSNRRRVLVIHRYYWPDAPPYASMLRAIVDRWTADGNQVDVLSTQPSYKPNARISAQPKRERLGTSTVRRIALPKDREGGPKKLLNVMIFPFLVFFHILFGRQRDVVMCSTAPPVTLGAAASWAAKLRGARFVYHCMDIHPEIGALSGEFRNPLVFRTLQRLDRGTCRRAAAIVVLSGDMKRFLLQRDRSIEPSIHILNNFELPDFSSSPGSTPSPPDRTDGFVRIVFTGNLGRFQGLDGVVEAVNRSEAGVELVLMGEGAAKPYLERLAAEAGERSRIMFVPHGTPAEARALMRSADFGLVSLTPGIINYAYPSKTMTYLAEGLPLLVIVEQDSELARTVAAEGIGYSVAHGDTAGLDSALHRIVGQKGNMERMKARAKLVGERDFGLGQKLDRWTELLDEVMTDEVVTR